MLTSTCGHRRLGQVARRLPAVRLKVASSLCCCQTDDLDGVFSVLQLVALQRTVLVQSLRHQELRSTAPRPQEAWSLERHNQIEKTYLITPRYQTSKSDLRMAQDSEIHLWDPRSGTSLKCADAVGATRL